MKQDGKTLINHMLVFGVILAIVEISVFLIVTYLHYGKSLMVLATYNTIEFWIWMIIRIGILLWALSRLGRKLEVFRFWKLALAAIGIMVLNYHLFYAYDVLDYYVIHEPPQDNGSDVLEKMLSLMQYRPAPSYSPIQVFLLPLTDILFYIRYGEFKALLSLLFFGALTLPLWVSAVVFFIFRNKGLNKKNLSENSLIDE
jgi:hypothetical protein